MDSPWPILLLFVLFVVGGFIVGGIMERRRRAELEEFARRLGFTFVPDPGGSYAEQYAGFTPFGQGRSRRASSLVRGARGEVHWELFDYRYTTGSGKNRRTHRYGVVVAKVPLALPRMTLRPEGMFDKVAALAGFDDINFESEAFSRRYHVTGDDRRRVYDLLHPQMMEYLLSLPAAHWQLGPGVVMQARSGRYDTVEMGRVTDAIDGFLSRVPAYVREDMSRGPVGA